MKALSWLAVNLDHPCLSDSIDSFCIGGGGATQLLGKKILEELFQADFRKEKFSKGTCRRIWKSIGGQGPYSDDREDRILGYDDDATLLTSRRYDYFINNFEQYMEKRKRFTHFYYDCEFGGFVDLDRDVPSRKRFVEKKWLVLAKGWSTRPYADYPILVVNK